MHKKFIPYGRQLINNDDVKGVVKVLRSDWLTQGPKVEEFEKAVANYCGAKYAVAVNSGTSALHLAYFVAGFKNGDEIITTPLTFAATSNMLSLLGAKPVFVDIDSKTLNINPELVEGSITSKTKAIVPVDFAGNPCDYEKIIKIAKKHKLLIIEDACHALGAEYRGKKIGSFADMTILSFHPVKHIATGEGGMVLTNNDKFYERLKIYRNHGIVRNPQKGAWYYEIETPFFNYRITDIQCALGISQLKKLKKFLIRRRQIAKKYNEEFKNFRNIIKPEQTPGASSAWHIYPAGFKKSVRRKIFDNLRKEGIGVQVHYMPLHLHPFYKNKFGYRKGDFPNAENYYESAITLPLFPKMSDSDVDYVIEKVKKYCSV